MYSIYLLFILEYDAITQQDDGHNYYFPSNFPSSPKWRDKNPNKTRYFKHEIRNETIIHCRKFSCFLTNILWTVFKLLHYFGVLLRHITMSRKKKPFHMQDNNFIFWGWNVYTTSWMWTRNKIIYRKLYEEHFITAKYMRVMYHIYVSIFIHINARVVR